MPPTARTLAAGPCTGAAPACRYARFPRRLAPMLLAAALVGLPLAGCASFADEPACPTLPPGAEVSPLPSRTPCVDTGGDGS